MTNFVIKHLNEADIMWGHTISGSVWIKTNGYHTQLHYDIEAFLIKNGYVYDFNRSISNFDNTTGKTTSYLKERKAS